MKYFFKREISNWRLVFVSLVFLSVLTITMSDELGLSNNHISYIYYMIYIFLAFSYLDIIWNKIKKRKPSNDILDNTD